MFRRGILGVGDLWLLSSLVINLIDNLLLLISLVEWLSRNVWLGTRNSRPAYRLGCDKGGYREQGKACDGHELHVDHVVKYGF